MDLIEEDDDVDTYVCKFCGAHIKIFESDDEEEEDEDDEWSL